MFYLYINFLTVIKLKNKNKNVRSVLQKYCRQSDFLNGLTLLHNILCDLKII